MDNHNREAWRLFQEISWGQETLDFVQRPEGVNPIKGGPTKSFMDVGRAIKAGPPAADERR